MGDPPRVAAAAMEVELKLEATAEAMETLLASPLLREHARSTVRARQLVSTYYDTPDRRLSRRQIAFRVRQSGRKFIQTLKAPNEAEGAVLARGEWEVELAECGAAPRRVRRPAVLELTGLILPDELEPVFETRLSAAVPAARVARRRPAVRRRSSWPSTAAPSGRTGASSRSARSSSSSRRGERAQPVRACGGDARRRAAAACSRWTRPARGYLLARGRAAAAGTRRAP